MLTQTVIRWTDIHVLSPAALHLSTQPSQYAAQTIPSLHDFQSLWTSWDIVTKAMVPREELLSEPIKLRNALIFYLGHIPTFSGQLTPLDLLNLCTKILTNRNNRYSFNSGVAKQADGTQGVPADL